jgi:hypothetical protein
MTDKMHLPLELAGTSLESTTIGLTGGFWWKKWLIKGKGNKKKVRTLGIGRARSDSDSLGMETISSGSECGD